MRNSREVITLVALTLAVALLGPARQLARSAPSGPGALVTTAPEGMLDPIWITRVEVGSQFLLDSTGFVHSPAPGEVLPGQRFQAGGNWLKNTTIYVINRTDKPVAWLEVSLQFPQTGNGRTQPTWIYQLRAGQEPAADVKVTEARNGRPMPPEVIGAESLDLQPGHTLAIHLADFMDKISAYLRTAMPVNQITECYIYTASCELSDGTRWTPN